jgi:hypothetical protein
LSSAWKEFEYTLTGNGEETAKLLNMLTAGIKGLTDSLSTIQQPSVNARHQADHLKELFTTTGPAMLLGLEHGVQEFIAGIPGAFAGISHALIDGLNKAIPIPGPPGSHGREVPNPMFGPTNYNALPPSGGGRMIQVRSAVYLDRTKLGESVTQHIADRATRPLEGSAYFDPTWHAPASDVSYA